MRELSAEHATHCLEQLGLRVENIDVVENEKRADLRAWHGDEEYLVEAKERLPHRDWIALRDQARAGSPGLIERLVEPWHVLTEVVQKASLQLASTPCSTHAFRILWTVAAHADAAFVLACLERNLLGTRSVFAVASGDDPGRILECYHYSVNSFELCPTIDAAVLSERSGGRLYVNCYSRNAERFRSSYLYAKFLKSNALVDPANEARSGAALLVADDFSGPRDGTRL